MAKQIIVTQNNYGILLETQFIDDAKNPIDLTGYSVSVEFEYLEKCFDVLDATIINAEEGRVGIILEQEHTAEIGLYKTQWSVVDDDENVTAQEDIYYFVKQEVAMEEEEKEEIGVNAESIVEKLKDLDEILLEHGKKLTEIEEARGTNSNLKERLDEVDSQLDNNTNQINSIIQIPLTKYIFLVEDDDWSPVIEYVISNYPEGEIFIPRSDNPYNFSRTIILGSNHSLKIDIGATIRATNGMEIFIQRHGHLTNLTREYNSYNRIYGGGFIDCNQKAKTGISLCGYRGYYIENINMLDALEYGIISKADVNGYAVELNLKDLKIENRHTNNKLGTCGILLNSTDNHLTDIVIVDTDIGIKCDVGADSNRMFRAHHWIRNKLRTDTADKCKSFVDYALCNTWDTCYGDSSNVGFEFTGGGTFINCAVFNSRFFTAVDMVGFKQIGTPKYKTSFINCTAQSDGAISPVKKAFDGEINDQLQFINCRTYSIVPSGFPHNPKYEADTYWGRKVDVTGTVKTPWINFSDDKAMTCNDDKIITLNGNPQLQFVSVPSSYDAPGVRGQIAHDERYLYIYIVNVGWKRIDLGNPW